MEGNDRDFIEPHACYLLISHNTSCVLRNLYMSSTITLHQDGLLIISSDTHESLATQL